MVDFINRAEPFSLHEVESILDYLENTGKTIELLSLMMLHDAVGGCPAIRKEINKIVLEAVLAVAPSPKPKGGIFYHG